MLIVKSEKMADVEYVKVAIPKKQIVLHHTVSSSSKSTINYFQEDKGKSKIAVAYVIDKDGTVFQLFEPEYWAWHIGKGSTIDNNKQSIGIEIVNEGQLIKRNDLDYYWWYDSKLYPQGRVKYTGKPFDLGYVWRGFQYFASYTDKQVESVQQLLDYLTDKFNIKRNFTGNFNYLKSYLDYEGVVMHVNLRPDKTDLSPAWDLNKVFSEPRVPLANLEAKPVEIVPAKDFIAMLREESFKYIKPGVV